MNMSSGTGEFGKCVKTQLQLVCSNYGSGEFVTTSLLIKRDFLIWMNVMYKGKFRGSMRFCEEHTQNGAGGLQAPPAASLAGQGDRVGGLEAGGRAASCLRCQLPVLSGH